MTRIFVIDFIDSFVSKILRSFFACSNLDSSSVCHSVILIIMDGEGGGEVEGDGTEFGSVLSPLRTLFDVGLVNLVLLAQLIFAKEPNVFHFHHH